MLRDPDRSRWCGQVFAGLRGSRDDNVQALLYGILADIATHDPSVGELFAGHGWAPLLADFINRKRGSVRPLPRPLSTSHCVRCCPWLGSGAVGEDLTWSPYFGAGENGDSCGASADGDADRGHGCGLRCRWNLLHHHASRTGLHSLPSLLLLTFFISVSSPASRGFLGSGWMHPCPRCVGGWVDVALDASTPV